VNATRDPIGTSGNNHGSLRFLTAAMNSGAPVKIGGGIGLCSSIIGSGGYGIGRERRDTASQSWIGWELTSRNELL